MTLQEYRMFKLYCEKEIIDMEEKVSKKYYSIEAILQQFEEMLEIKDAYTKEIEDLKGELEILRADYNTLQREYWHLEDEINEIEA